MVWGAGYPALKSRPIRVFCGEACGWTSSGVGPGHAMPEEAHNQSTQLCLWYWLPCAVGTLPTESSPSPYLLSLSGQIAFPALVATAGEASTCYSAITPHGLHLQILFSLSVLKSRAHLISLFPNTLTVNTWAFLRIN